MEATSFSHTGNIGDVWASIPAMQQHFVNTGKVIDLYLIKNVPAFYYDGAVHPTKDDAGANVNVMLNQKMIDMMIPLLKAQSFINQVHSIDFSEYDAYKDKIQVHLEWFRENQIGLPNFSINRWYFYVFPDLTSDLSAIWLEVPHTDKDIAANKIVVTRSERYTNPSIDYSFLKPYEDDIVFCGTMREYNNFCMSYDLNIRKLNINNFLELAQAINQCRFHITNQTQAFQLSEGLKVPRILELCTYAANCIPIGEDAYDFHSQLGLEYAFNKLNGTTEVFFEKVKAIQETKKAAL
ncbi:MAG TPA: hypothetical protein VHL77_00685 [Ferruginibacter sp.]|jgi:hypothetical protein|nr:hypothetical protein [Ferruginibacter sp.]